MLTCKIKIGSTQKRGFLGLVVVVHLACLFWSGHKVESLLQNYSSTKKKLFKTPISLTGKEVNVALFENGQNECTKQLDFAQADLCVACSFGKGSTTISLMTFFKILVFLNQPEKLNSSPPLTTENVS